MRTLHSTPDKSLSFDTIQIVLKLCYNFNRSQGNKAQFLIYWLACHSVAMADKRPTSSEFQFSLFTEIFYKSFKKTEAFKIYRYINERNNSNN